MIAFRSIYLDSPAVAGRVVDFFQPEGPPRDHAMFLIHGGGWKAGARANLHGIALAFRDHGFEVATTDYRLSNVTAFEQIADVRDALELYHRDLRERGHSGRIVLYGSSAGAHLALMTALLSDPPPRTGVAGICVQSAPFTFEPWRDIFPASWQNMQEIAGEPFSAAPERYRRLSPIHYIAPDMPPLFALHAGNEHMFPLELTRLFVRQARACGARAEYKVYPRTEHGFFYNLERWQQREALDDIIRFTESLSS